MVMHMNVGLQKNADKNKEKGDKGTVLLSPDDQ